MCLREGRWGGADTPPVSSGAVRRRQGPEGRRPPPDRAALPHPPGGGQAVGRGGHAVVVVEPLAQHLQHVLVLLKPFAPLVVLELERQGLETTEFMIPSISYFIFGLLRHSKDMFRSR